MLLSREPESSATLIKDGVRRMCGSRALPFRDGHPAMDFAHWRIDPPARVFTVQMSCRDRRLIESAAMRFPSVAVERGDILPCLDWRPSFQRRMRSMRIVEVFEFSQFLFQVRRGPEQHPIQAFSSQCSDQPFDKRMGHRNVGNTLDLGHAQHP